MKFAKVLVTPVNSKVSSCQLAEPEVPPEPALVRIARIENTGNKQIIKVFFLISFQAFDSEPNSFRF